MTARAIGDILGGRPTKTRRTFQPVRRNSFDVGHRERQVWRPIPGRWREVSARLKAARRYDLDNKQPGKRNGPLGHVALEVLAQLYNMVDFKTGELQPAIDTICKKIRRSRPAVVAAMSRLRDHGFLTWIRRTEPTGNEGFGPQVRQITNAYGFDLPAKAAAFVRWLLDKGPQPDDDIQRRADDAAATEQMVTSLPLAEQGAARGIQDAHLRKKLAEIGASLDASNASSLNGQNPEHDE